MRTKLKKSHVVSLVIILGSIIGVFIISRIITFLILSGYFPSKLFLDFNGFRLHHFVYGNILIITTSFLAIGLGIKKHKNWFSLFYGIGLGLVLDEFLLWIGNVKELTRNVLFIPYSLSAVAITSILIASIIMYKLHLSSEKK